MWRLQGRGIKARLTGVTVASLIIGAFAAQGAAGQTAGSFAPTGDMVVPRVDAAAAPLGDGRVLVAGGVDPTEVNSPPVLSSAEIFDPGTGTFSPTGSMTIPRADAAAAPLPDGRVLIAGGNDHNYPDYALKSAEIFDPATGTFSPTGDMTVIRNGPAAAPLPDGRVLVAGGTYAGTMLQQYLNSAEIFDPRTGSFSPTRSMTQRRSNAAAAAPLPDGGALVAGGGWPSGQNSAEIFDSATGTFAPTRAMTDDRLTAAAAPLPDGRALVVGGGGASFGYSAEIFDPVKGAFAPAGYTTTPRYGPVAAPLSDGRVLVAGSVVGFGPHGLDQPRSAEIYTPDLSYRLTGSKLTVSAAVAGTLTAAEAKPRRRASGAARNSRPLLKSRSVAGRPRSISLKLRLTGRAKRILQRKSKLKLHVRLGFVPKPVKGKCVTQFSPCYSSDYAIAQAIRVTLKAKKRR
jgi:Kelch motif protein